MTSSKPTVDNSAKIKEVVCEILEIDPNELTEGSVFSKDHGADSMSVIAILSALEITFDVEIDQSELNRMVDLRGVTSVVDQALAAR
jgi:acyl carrier protein